MTMSLCMIPSCVSLSDRQKCPTHTLHEAQDETDVHDVVDMKSKNASCEFRSRVDTRKVRFGHAEVVGRVECRSSLCTKQRDKRWFSNDQFSKVKKECLQELKSLKTSENADMFSYRGMELVDPESIVRRQRRHTNSISAVLIEQREQRSKAVSDAAIQTAPKVPHNPKAIRKVYKKVAIDSMKEALENAYIDKKAVQQYMLNVEEELRIEYERTRAENKMHSSPRKNLVSLFSPRKTQTSGFNSAISSRSGACNEYDAPLREVEPLASMSRSLTECSIASSMPSSREGD
ncbi:hypothetical protein IV203_016130 [Nitzschia inconspicua]|uniref:Uncharacterized protein n=1 Tax=Nitzschia inconspicua TaxID=303405 RepID=A0A9K3PHI4_9STRA|nr:hypothetical protein IV203_016130 [Nitzschia inconspicua]